MSGVAVENSPDLRVPLLGVRSPLRVHEAAVHLEWCLAEPPGGFPIDAVLERNLSEKELLWPVINQPSL